MLYHLLISKEQMQNLVYFNPALMSHYQFMQNIILTQNNAGNFIFVPLYSTPVPSNQNSLNVSSNQFSAIPVEKTQEVTHSAELEAKCEAVPVKSQKLRKQFHSKTEEEQQYRVKMIKNTVGVSYKKKNTESNIVNQTFSYLSSDRSKNLILTFFKKDIQKTNQFYLLMTKIRQANKKYINRKYLKRLIEFEKGSQFFRVYTKSKIYAINISEIREILRILTFQFLRNHINISLLTSSKIYKETLFQHFWRKREVMNFLFGDKNNHCF